MTSKNEQPAAAQLSIRPVYGITEAEAVSDLQAAAWGFSDRDLIPAHSLIAIQKSGGAVIGAYLTTVSPRRRAEAAQLVGFALGWTGLRGSKAFHYSDMLAVLPEYQQHNIGYLLKLAQREAVMAQGLELMAWTYDPLVARNAWFNIVKLGCTAKEYTANLYGELHSATHSGLPTDRFTADWALRSARVVGRVGRPLSEQLRSFNEQVNWQQPPRRSTAPDEEPFQLQDHQLVTVTSLHPEGYRLLDQIDLDTPLGMVWAEIPADIDKIRNHDPEAALHWRMQSRTLFQHYFGRGYFVSGMVRSRFAGERRVFYQLEMTTV